MCHHDSGGDLCVQCGWQLFDDPILGAADDEDRKAAATAATTAAHLWDLRAAVLAVPDPGGIGALAGLLRGGPPVRPLPRPEVPPAQPGGADPPWWRGLLTELTTGRLTDAVLVLVDADGVRLVTVTSTSTGIPGSSLRAAADWHEVVPALAGDPAVRGFQLAGGIGTLPPVDRAVFDSAVRRWLTAQLPPSQTGAVVLLLNGPSGRVLLDRASEVVRRTYRLRGELAAEPTPTGGPVDTGADRIRRLLRTAPLRCGHALLMAHAEPGTGTVRLERRVLFSAGTRLRPGESLTASVTVHGGVTDNPAVALPVLVGHHPEGGAEDGDLLVVHRTAVPALGSVVLDFVLHGPGEVTVSRADGGRMESETPASAVELAELVSRLAQRVEAPPQMDLVCAIEMSGEQVEEAAERVRFVGDLVRHLMEHQGETGAMRLGAIGYYDHLAQSPYRPRPTVLRRARPGPVRTTLNALRNWPLLQRERDTATSLEDALELAAAFTEPPVGGRNADRTVVVLVIGRRPPGLPHQHSLVPTCPRGVDWREQVGRLRANGVQVMTRTDPPSEVPPPDRVGRRLHRHSVEAWRELGRQGAFRPGTDSADTIAQFLAPPWRTHGGSCPLAFADTLRRQHTRPETRIP